VTTPELNFDLSEVEVPDLEFVLSDADQKPSIEFVISEG